MKTHPRAVNAVGLALVLNIALAPLIKAELEPLFLDAPVALQARARPADVQAARSRVVRLNQRLLEPGKNSLQNVGGRFRANLFSDQEYTVVVDKAEISGPGDFTCLGHVKDVAGSQLLLASVDGAVQGTVRVPFQDPFQVQFTGDGLHRVNQVSPPRGDWCLAGNTAAADDGTLALDSAPRARLSDIALASANPTVDTNSPPPIIDFLVVYTPRVLAAAGGDSGINALINFIVAENNFCYANSGIHAHWNIMARSLVNYAESGSIGTDLNWLSSSTAVAALKNSSKADLVMLLAEFDRNGWWGMASGDKTVFIRPAVTTGYFTVPHEVGHLFGAGHDRFTCGAPSAHAGCGAQFAYSYGHRFEAAGITFRTIMAYDPGVPIPYFSNPNVLFHGVPTGVAQGATNSADNARTINVTAPIVANRMKATCRFELATNAYQVLESAGFLTVDVWRTGDTNLEATVQCVTSAGTAAVGEDFVASTNLLTFLPGEIHQAVNIELLDDTVAEGDETMVVSLRNAKSGMGLGVTSSATLTILDDELFFRLAEASPVLPEGNSISIPVRRGGDTNTAATVDYATVDGTAVEGIDYVPASGTVAFAPGELEKPLAVVSIANPSAAPDKQFAVALKNTGRGGLAPPSSVAVTVMDRQRPGSLDVEFQESTGLSDGFYTRSVRPDGKVLFCGRFRQLDGKVRTLLKQYLPDGLLDPEFAPVEFGNTTSPESGVLPTWTTTILVQPDDRILVAGQFGLVDGVLHQNLVRLNPNGTVDPSFSASANGSTDLLLQPDGRIVVWGFFLTMNAAARPFLARLTPDGNLDPAFNPKPNPDTLWIMCAALQSDGKLLVAGSFWGFEGRAKENFARLNPDGTLDRGYLGTANGAVNRIVVLPDQRALIGGCFTSPRNGLALLGPDGRVDSSFNPKTLFNAPINCFQRLPDGRIMVAGSFTRAGVSKQNYLVRLNGDGSLDTTFDSGLGPSDWLWGLGGASCLTIDPNGWIVIGGPFTQVNGYPVSFIARLRSDGTRPTFSSPTLLANGQVSMRLFGNATSTYALESSADMVTWMPVWTNRFTKTSWEWTEQAAPATAAQFYRARQIQP